jgi:hypothetical protein
MTDFATTERVYDFFFFLKVHIVLTELSKPKAALYVCVLNIKEMSISNEHTLSFSHTALMNRRL